MKRTLLLLLTLVMLVSVFSACTKEQPEEQKTTEPVITEEAVEEVEATEEPPVELTYYFMHSPVDSLERMNEAVNEITLEKINATIDFKLLDATQFPQKMKLKVSAGEPFDLAFSASWSEFEYFQNAAAGAFLPLDDLMKEYAPTSYSRVPEQIWNGVKVNGNIYGVINYQVWGMSNAIGVQLRKDLVDEFGFDWQSVGGWDDLDPFLQAVKDNYPEMIPFEYLGNYDNFVKMPAVYGMDAVGDNQSVGWVKYNDEKITVYNQYKTDEYKAYLDTFHRWYQAGFIKKDAATIMDGNPDRQADRVAAIYAQTMPDMVDYSEQIGMIKMSMSDSKLAYTKRFTEPYVSGSAPSATVTTIGANSKHPVKAMQYIELVNTDDVLFNTTALGIEGIDYEVVAEGKYVKTTPDTPHAWFPEWQMGQSFGRLWWTDLAGIVDEETYNSRQNMLNTKYELEPDAMASPLLGFVFDTTPVASEIANCEQVFNKYLAALGSGTLDPEEYLSVFLDELDAAGAEKIIAEKQSQIDTWVASN